MSGFAPPTGSNGINHEEHDVHEDSLDTGFLFSVTSQAKPLSFQLGIPSTLPCHIFINDLRALRVLRGLPVFSNVKLSDHGTVWSPIYDSLVISQMHVRRSVVHSSAWFEFLFVNHGFHG